MDKPFTPWLALAAIATSLGCRNGSEPPRGKRAETATFSPSASSPGEAGAKSTLDDRTRFDRTAALMMSFAERTGLTSTQPKQSERRYLWTDAFAVTNFLGLSRATGERHYSDLALLLVDRVHHALGKHRPDDARKGWLSGLDPEQGEGHPTRGGLRIGKQLPERRPDQPPDQELEWDRDGQYFHYLTQWMHALNQVALWTRRPVFNLWSRELADTAHRAFVQGAPARRRMFWKMSIDLTRPLVASMGQHDALDGYVTCLELELTASPSPERSGPKLDGAASDFASMIEDRQLATDDPLGIGGLLLAAYRVQRLLSAGASAQKGLLEKVLTGALSGLDTYAQEGALREPAETRLAFRELGLAIGLHAVLSLRGEPRSLLRQFDRYAPLEAQIISFWLDPSHQKSASFMEHLDINQVMLATSLAPEGYLGGAL